VADTSFDVERAALQGIVDNPTSATALKSALAQVKTNCYVRFYQLKEMKAVISDRYYTYLPAVDAY